MIEVCETCRHWSGLREEWGRCDLGSSAGGEPDFDHALAVAQDYESYRASLYTKPSYGCVQWESKRES